MAGSWKKNKGGVLRHAKRYAVDLNSSEKKSLAAQLEEEAWGND